MIHFVFSPLGKLSNSSAKKKGKGKIPECVVTLFTVGYDSLRSDEYLAPLKGLVSNAGLNSLQDKVNEWWKGKNSDLEFSSLDPACCHLYFVRGHGDAGSSLSIRSFLRVGVSITRLCRRLKIKTVRLEVVGELGINEILAVVEGAKLEDYEFVKYKSKHALSSLGLGDSKVSKRKKGTTTPKNEDVEPSFVEIEYVDRANLHSGKDIQSVFKLRIARIVEAVAGVHLARDLINTPPSDCSPSHIVKYCKELFSNTQVKLEILDSKKLKKIGANSILAVGNGSPGGSYLLKLRLPMKAGGKTGEHVALVGKGVTYDSGGLSLKPADSLELMKFDMAGAATVIGVMHALSRMETKGIQGAITAYIPLVENLVDGCSYKPGDVILTHSGKFVEVLNTDAEGRLILADALSIAQQDGATTVIDVATLTGACVVALGSRVAGLFSRSDELVARIKECGELSGEDFWHLPLHDDYRELLKSNTADLKNISGGKWGGAITAALFLEEFIAIPRWVHLDIAGPAFAEKLNLDSSYGGVGFGVRTLLRFISGID